MAEQGCPDQRAGRRGVVYVLMNKAMPGYVKIGRTINTSDERARQLSGATGVPEDFEVVFDVIVSDVEQVERLVHARLDNVRPNKRREFFRTDIRTAIRTVSEISSLFPAGEEDSSSVQILPQLETRMRRWLRREIISVEFVQYSDLCIARVTEQPILAANYAKSIAFNLEVLGGSNCDHDLLFDPYCRSISKNVSTFLEELDPYSMAMVGIPLLSDEATQHIVYHQGEENSPMQPEECAVTELWLEGWTIDSAPGNQTFIDLQSLDMNIRQRISKATGRRDDNGWPRAQFNLTP
ncbi:GIY-YIG nuclease family protein [Nocardia vulneris]|uniref:GIY-YIG nuclease family protein n=1 Tax=Nocardia vulneris TaxID=1141657 RepID=UPI0014354BD4|nr:GIY-YIG nuclease family protein [Nocardia vulneris]